MKNIIFLLCCICFCVPCIAMAEISANYSFLPVSDNQVTSYNIHFRAIPQGDTEPVTIAVSQPTDITKRIYVTIPNLTAGITYVFTVSSVTAQGVEGESSEPLFFSTIFDSNLTKPSKVDDFQVELTAH